jgi:ribonuclease-3
MSDPLASLESRLGHRFHERELLERALIHQSYLADHPRTPESNQRLEFLGDAVLQILIAEELFQLFPTEREGPLSRRRSMLVNGPFLAQLARELGLEPLLRLGASEENSGGRERLSILGDAFEALVGALYLDAGLAPTRVVVRGIYGDLEARLTGIEEKDNPKGRLQERVQPRHGNDALRYEVVRTGGEDHARTYEVAVYLLDRHLGTGSGTSKKLAEEAAARVALTVLPQTGLI